MKRMPNAEVERLLNKIKDKDQALLTETLLDSLSKTEKYFQETRYLRKLYYKVTPFSQEEKRKEEEKHVFKEKVIFFDKEITLQSSLDCSSFNYTQSKNWNLNDLKPFLKETQLYLYILHFDKYKDEIRKIDELIEFKTTKTEEEYLFNLKWYLKKVGTRLHILKGV